MVQTEDQQVKRHSPLVEWVDTHPRTGWYVAALLTLNTVLNVLDLFT